VESKWRVNEIIFVYDKLFTMSKYVTQIIFLNN
jgi:hypothetical protein